MLSRRWIRPIASANSGATETNVTFSDSSTGWVSIESVTIKRSIGLRSRRSIDPSAKTPCVTTAVTERGTARNELFGGLHERTGTDSEIVHDNGIAISDLADDLYQFGSLTVTPADLVRDCERRTEVLRESACALGEAGIG